LQPALTFSHLHKEQSTLQYIMQLSPGPATEDDDRYPMRVLCYILGDDSGSRLFWELLDTGLAESAAIGSCEYLGSGAVMSYLCCSPDRAQDNLQRMQQIQRSAREGVTEKEFNLAKQKIAAQILMASERTETRMFSIGGQWLNGQDIKTPAEIAECYRNVTLDQVNEVARRYPLDQNCTVSIGPNSALIRPE
jgi:predicted Zn-dependent peptidase